MKKILILLVALFISVASANAETALVGGMTESALLETLTGKDMSVEGAVKKIIAAGGDQTRTLAAATTHDPSFDSSAYVATSDPTADLGLDAPAAGPGNGLLAPSTEPSSRRFGGGTSGGGGGSVSP